MQDGVFRHQAQPADVIGWFEVDVGRKGSPSDGEGVAAIIKSNGNECLLAEAFSTAKASKSLWGEVGLFYHLQMPTT